MQLTVSKNFNPVDATACRARFLRALSEHLGKPMTEPTATRLGWPRMRFSDSFAAGRARIGAEEDAAFRIVLEGVDFGATALLRDSAGVPGVADAALVAMVTHEFEHSLPLGKDDDLGVVAGAFVEQFFNFSELGADAVAGIEDVICVANHPHHREFALELVLFLLRERAALGDVDELQHLLLVAAIVLFLQFAQRDEMIPVGAFGQFGFHVGLAAAKHERF